MKSYHFIFTLLIFLSGHGVIAATPSKSSSGLDKALAELESTVKQEKDSRKKAAFIQLGKALVSIEKGQDINAADANGRTVLMMAAVLDQTAIVQTLIEISADPLLEDKKGKTALDYAHNDTIKSLLKGKKTDTPIKYPELTIKSYEEIIETLDIKKDNIKEKELKLLLQKCLETGTVNFYGGFSNWTPLMSAASLKRLDIVRFLVESKGADVNYSDNIGQTPAVAACSENDNLEILKYLGSRGANFNANSKYIAGTAILWAVSFADYPMVVYLIDQGTDFKNAAILSSAVTRRGEKLNIVQCLVERGADIQAKNITHEGKTALELATDENVKNYLEARCAMVPDYRDPSGNSLLHIAARFGNTQAVRDLLLKKCDPGAKNNEGKTPGEVAMEQKHLDVVKLLKEK